MTKSELIERIAQDADLTRGRAELVVNAIFDSMVGALVKGEGIEIRGFGSFSVRNYKAYEGRNPRTGDVVRVSPKRMPFFKIGKDLRERINGKIPEDEPLESHSTENQSSHGSSERQPSKPRAATPPSETEDAI